MQKNQRVTLLDVHKKDKKYPKLLNREKVANLSNYRHKQEEKHYQQQPALNPKQ